MAFPRSLWLACRAFCGTDWCSGVTPALRTPSVRQPPCLKLSGGPVNADGSEKHHASAECRTEPVTVCVKAKGRTTLTAFRNTPLCLLAANGVVFKFYFRRKRRRG